MGNVKQKSNKRFMPKAFLGLTLLTWIVCTFFALKAIGQPLEVEQQVDINTVVQKTDFAYKADVVPSALYPDGGVVTPEGPIFTELLKELRIDIQSVIEADKNVIVEGNKGVILTLIAENLWQRRQQLDAESDFTLQGLNNQVINGTYSINLLELQNFIDQVEEETKVPAGKYLLKVKPIVTGIIVGSEKIDIDQSPELTFELKGNTLQIIGDKEYSKETVFKKTEVLTEPFQFFGQELAVFTARKVFGILSVGLLILMLIIVKLFGFQRVLLGGRATSRAAKIDKKYRSRMVSIKEALNNVSKHSVALDSFKSLLKIADEKELPILRYENGRENAIYHVVDGEYVYNYHLEDNHEIKMDINTGSDVANV